MSDETVFDVSVCRASLQARQERQYQVRERRRLAALRAVRAAVRDILPHFPSVRRVYVFGSLLRPGGMRSTSDLDLAVDGDLMAEDYFALWRKLEQAVEGWPIDLVELDRDLYFAARVREKGELIYACTEHGRSERANPDTEGGY